MTDYIMHVQYNWGAGEMHINIPELLRSQTIGKINKLVKLIERSQTPMELNKMVQYIESRKEELDPLMGAQANRAVDNHTRYKELEPQLEKLKAEQSRWKKNSPHYIALAEKIKTLKTQISTAKKAYRSAKTEFNALQREKDKLEKLKLSEI